MKERTREYEIETVHEDEKGQGKDEIEGGREKQAV